MIFNRNYQGRRSGLLKKIFISAVFMLSCSIKAQVYDFIDKPFYKYQALDSLSTDSIKVNKIIFGENKINKPDIIKKGTIYRGIKIDADSGAGMVSGLNLEVAGNLTDSIEVSAYISDDRLAVTEEGSSESFSDIEKIYIQFRHPNFLSRMGDFKTDYKSGEFGELKKELSGAFFKVNSRNNYVEGFISGQSPVFEAFQTTGIEGISGPYILRSGYASETEIIPGSETVYINGKRLERGEEFYIDYQSSELYIKPGIHVRSGDIISADFQYKVSDYEKTVYGFNSRNSFFKSNLSADVSFFSESDNKNKPVDFEMNDEISEAMEADQSSYIYISGAELSTGKGDYDMLPDSLHYVYAGAGNGDYRVRFTKTVSAGEYDVSYDSLGTAYFIYDPVEGGDYLPLIRRNAPASYSRFHSSVNYKGRNFEAETEFVASAENENLFYSDDTEFSGLGDREKITLKTDEKKYGKFEFDLSRKYFNSDLELTSRLNEVASEDKIDIYSGSNIFKTLIYKGKISHSYGKHFLTGYEKEYSRSGRSNLKSDKIISEGGLGRYSYAGSVTLSNLNRDSIDTEKRFYDFNNNYKSEHFFIEPYYKKIKTKEITGSNTTGIDEEKFGSNLGFSNKDQLNVDIKTELAVYETMQNGDRTKFFKSYSNSAEIKSRISSVLYSEALWSKVVNKFTSRDSTDTDYDQLEFRINYNKSDMYRIYAEYATERTRFIPKVRTYYKVEEGTGSFVFADGEYFPDEFGNYDYYTAISDEGKDVTGVKFDLKTYFDFKDRNSNDNITYWLSRIDIEQSIFLYEKTTDPDIAEIMFLNIKKFQSDSTVSGTIDSKTTLSFMKKNRNSYDYSYYYRKNMSGEYLNYTENSLLKEHTAVYTHRSDKFTHRFKGRLSNSSRYGSGGSLSDELGKKYYSYNIRHNINASTYYFTEIEYGNETESVRDIVSDSYRIFSGITSGIFGKGIVRSEAEAVRIFCDGQIPFTMNSGYGSGWSYKWRVSSDYEFSASVTGSLSYNGRFLSNDPKPFHELKAEILMNL